MYVDLKFKPCDGFLILLRKNFSNLRVSSESHSLFFGNLVCSESHFWRPIAQGWVCIRIVTTQKNKTNSVASVRERTRDRRLLEKLVPAFADRRCRVVSVTDPYSRVLGFLDRSRYFFFQVAPQLYSRS
jgi:hypothetical protein